MMETVEFDPKKLLDYLESLHRKYKSVEGQLTEPEIINNQGQYRELSRELSHLSPWRPAIYPFKTLIPLTFFMLTTQGVVELIRCIWKFREQKGGGK